MKAKKFHVLATAVLIGMGSLASAGDEIHVKVDYTDLDIHSRDDATVLYARLERAAREACGLEYYWRERDLRQTANAKRCYQRALANAVQKIDSGVLADIHRDKAGRDA